MLVNEGYMNNTHVIQISTCHRFASVCFDTRETVLAFTTAEHSLINTPTKFYPDYYQKKRISIENLPIELPDKEVKNFLSEYATLFGKTYYPGTKFQNKYITTGTRIYQYTTISKNIPKHLYKFGRYLRIRYDEQPKEDDNSETQSELPRNVTFIQQETITPNTTPKPRTDDNPDTQLEPPRKVTYTQQEASQILPTTTPTPQLPDTPTITPEIQTTDEPQIEQEHTTPLRKEKMQTNKQSTKHSKAKCNGGEHQ